MAGQSRVTDHNNLSQTIKSYVPQIIDVLSQVFFMAGHSHIFELKPIHPESTVRDLRRGVVQAASMASALGQEFPASNSQDHLRFFRAVVGTLIATKKSLSPRTIQNLLGDAFHSYTQASGGDDVEGIIQKVYSALNSQQHEGTPAVAGQYTFGKFMSSSNCPTYLRIDIPSCRRQLAVRCFVRMHESLERNMCRLEDPSVPKADISDLEIRLAHFVPEDLQYACGFWAMHLFESPPNDDEMYGLLKSFFCKDVRNWLEVVCLVETAERAILICDQAKAWIEVSISVISSLHNDVS